MLLQLEMYPNQQQQQQQQSSTVVLQPTGPVQPVAYIVSSAPRVCESYDSGQSIAAGISLIIAGVLSIIFNILGILYHEILYFVGDGFWCGVMVSLSLVFL